MPGSSEAPDQGEIASEVWLEQLFFRRGDRTGEPASSLIHRGPTLTRVPEKWIRWLVNRGESFVQSCLAGYGILDMKNCRRLSIWTAIKYDRGST